MLFYSADSLITKLVKTYFPDFIQLSLPDAIEKAKTLKQLVFIFFHGGADVHPRLYNEQPILETCFSIERDEEDLFLYHSTPDACHVGICRGSQFLNVMNEGKLWQDVNNHGRSHYVYNNKNERVLVTSTHHQMMIPSTKGQILWTAKESTKRKKYNLSISKFFNDDIEVVFYPNTLSLCMQFHPEYDIHGECGLLFAQLMIKKFHINKSLKYVAKDIVEAPIRIEIF